MTARLYDYLKPAIESLADDGELLAIAAVRRGLHPTETLRLADIFLQHPKIRLAYSQWETAKAEAKAVITQAEARVITDSPHSLELAAQQVPTDDEGKGMKKRMTKAQKSDLPLSFFSRLLGNAELHQKGITDDELTLLAKTEYNIGRHLRELANRFTGTNPKGGQYRGLEHAAEMQEAGQDGITCLLCLKEKTIPPQFPAYLAEQLAMGEKPSIVACRYMYLRAFQRAKDFYRSDSVSDKEMENLLSVEPFAPTVEGAIHLWLAEVEKKAGRGLAIRLAKAYLVELRKAQGRRETPKDAKRKENLKRKADTLSATLPDSFRQAITRQATPLEIAWQPTRQTVSLQAE